MPRDSHMLPEHSQQLLRAARSGRTVKPAVPPEDDIEMKEEEEEPKEIRTGFTIKKFVKVARHLEAPEPEYLAKRRKGLPSPYAQVNQAAVRETKVKKLDAEGNVTVYKVLAPEGQTVEGEVAPTDEAMEAAPAIAAPGTVVEIGSMVGVVNADGVVVANDIVQQTPPRRRPPPPKKKGRGGPGRGRKRVVFAEGSTEQGTPASNAGSDRPQIPGLKHEGGSMEPSDRDTPMGEAGDEEGSGEEGSDDEDQDPEHTPAPTTPSNPTATTTSSVTVEMMDAPEEVIKSEASNDTQPPSNVTAEAPGVSEDKIQSHVPSPSQDKMELDDERGRSSSPNLPLTAADHSGQDSNTQIPTSATSFDPVTSATIKTETPIPSTEVEPVSEPTPEPVSEPAPEPTYEPAHEPTYEPAPEPAPEQAPEPAPEQAPEQAPEPATESAAGPAEPAIEPASEPTSAPASAPIPMAASEPEPVAAPEPVLISESVPVAQPVAVAESSEPVVIAEPSEPVVVAAIEPVAAVVEDVTDVSPVAVVESVPVTETVAVVEPVVEPVAEPVAEPAAEVVVELAPAPESAPQPAPESVSEPIAETTEASPAGVPSVPPSESEPDLLGSLERELDREGDGFAEQ
jgi:hypothetical protein